MPLLQLVLKKIHSIICLLCCTILYGVFFFFCTQGIEIEGELPDKVKSYEGVYYNYFSIGTLIYTFSVVA